MLWKAVEPVLTQALVALIPVLATFLAAELRRRSRLALVKNAIRTDEEENWDECPYEKKARAVELVQAHSNKLNAMNPTEIGKMVEKVLPKVKEELAEKRPSRSGKRDRRSVEVKFDDQSR